MTASEIIEEIKHLPPKERERVADYVTEQSRETRQLSGGQLGQLAEEMLNSDDPAEKAALREEITKGFYGN